MSNDFVNDGRTFEENMIAIESVIIAIGIGIIVVNVICL